MIGAVEQGFEDALGKCSWIGDEHGAEVALARSLAQEIDSMTGSGRALGAVANAYDRTLRGLLMSPSVSPPVPTNVKGRLDELLEVHDDG
jgi:hypothetical protein